MQDQKFLQRLIQFTVDVITFSKTNHEHRHRAPVFSQVIRSAGSIGANITEAHGASSTALYSRYFTIALQSAHETNYWLQVLTKLELKQPVVNQLSDEALSFIKILTASLKTLRNKP